MPVFFNLGLVLFQLQGRVGQASGQQPRPAPQSTSDGEGESAAVPESRADWRWIFDGGADSLVAHCVGAAEGTRTPSGAINPAYFGHTDPGNQVWNKGTFSYQHGAATPEEGDRLQLERLLGQAEIQENQAYEQGLVMTLEERLQGIDLANQSPTSGLGSNGRIRSRGYVSLLVDAKLLGVGGEVVHEGYALPADVAWARVSSYIDPQTNRWTSSGLGATESDTRRDQQRRMVACDKAIKAWREKGTVPEGW